MKKIISMFLILAITLFVVVSPVNAEGLQKVVASEGVFGCVHKDYYKNLISTLVDGDREAFADGLITAYQSGECARFEKGQEVYLADAEIFSGLNSIRPKGSMTAYWTGIENTKNKR